ncbi:hypothetical protein [Flavobacterium sufflavum]|nr:hypothetical protein [Flavobacterium sufflavum]
MRTILAIFLLGTMAITYAQEASVESRASVGKTPDKITYYQQRGAEDAKYELSFEAKTKAEEKAFWKEQKAYEKELKERDRKAYRAYIASKKEVYVEHYNHCDAHCHHDDYFYSHAGFYYYQYDQPNYQRTPSSTSINTQIGVRTPSVRLGL